MLGARHSLIGVSKAAELNKEEWTDNFNFQKSVFRAIYMVYEFREHTIWCETRNGDRTEWISYERRFTLCNGFEVHSGPTFQRGHRGLPRQFMTLARADLWQIDGHKFTALTVKLLTVFKLFRFWDLRAPMVVHERPYSYQFLRLFCPVIFLFRPLTTKNKVPRKPMVDIVHKVPYT